MLTAGYTSVPEIRTPLRTVVILSVITLGCYLWWQHKKSVEEDEKDSAI